MGVLRRCPSANLGREADIFLLSPLVPRLQVVAQELMRCAELLGHRPQR